MFSLECLQRVTHTHEAMQVVAVVTQNERTHTCGLNSHSSCHAFPIRKLDFDPNICLSYTNYTDVPWRSVVPDNAAFQAIIQLVTLLHQSHQYPQQCPPFLQHPNAFRCSQINPVSSTPSTPLQIPTDVPTTTSHVTTLNDWGSEHVKGWRKVELSVSHARALT